MVTTETLVTPALAKKYLATQRANRKVKKFRVEQYATAMSEGKWGESHQGIAFDQNGELYDGQHRLLAVIKSGVPVRMVVAHAEGPVDRSTVDGGAARRAADELSILGLDNVNQRVAVANLMCLLENGWATSLMKRSNMATVEAVLERAPAVTWAVHNLGTHPFRAQPISGAFAFAYAAAPEVAEYVPSFVSGVLTANDPMLLLRNTILREGTGINGWDERRRMSLRVLRALWAKHTGRPLLKLHDSADGVIGFLKLRGLPVPQTWLDYRTKHLAT